MTGARRTRDCRSRPIYYRGHDCRARRPLIVHGNRFGIICDIIVRLHDPVRSASVHIVARPRPNNQQLRRINYAGACLFIGLIPRTRYHRPPGSKSSSPRRFFIFFPPRFFFSVRPLSPAYLRRAGTPSDAKRRRPREQRTTYGSPAGVRRFVIRAVYFDRFADLSVRY